ncbi:MAG: ABC transporter substrate-binding protein [Pelagibacteraceae bacterium]|jgi:peptide/nickel transport system substrate-binding protein|nr:ABC transporter substrate-binding protein [Pelagibacteraceae bacterium]MBT3901229.1 ABC transporter substrate-binding protein [Pelagibacteraceae bacterium]MBT4950663.1 ABC transporter substrate-binding protein [Pelagibacteraceae bacterium]MBT5213849.1 ABC transporter substrate-binding protein [Pelagibacteraceae bacterium]MBT6354793.1 ABC transporter substrate-binding protein [Pelagibacteraceae bacterium]
MKKLITGVAIVFGLILPSTYTLAAPPDDTFVVGLPTDTKGLEPAQISSRHTANIMKHMFGTLFFISEKGTLDPNLAESYSVSDDAKEYTFKLKEGLTCHDGEPLTAEDVAYTFNRVVDPDLAFVGNSAGFVFPSIDFQEARADSELEVTIVMGAPNHVALGLISEVYVHCKDSYEKMSKEEAAENPIGSGAYEFVKWDKGNQIVMKKAKGSAVSANFENLIWRVIPEASTRTAELIAGNVDMITNASPDQVDAIDASNSAKVQKVSGTRRMYVGFHQGEEYAVTEGGAAIQKAEVRRAIQYAVDVEAICANLLNAPCERATGLVNPNNAHPTLKPYPYNPEIAEYLLDQAGYPRDGNGVRFEITLEAGQGRYLNDKNVVLAICQYLDDIGIKTTCDIMDWSSVYVPKIRKKEAGPMFFLGSGGGTWNPLYDMSDLATVESGPNYTKWTNEEWFKGWKVINNSMDPYVIRREIDRMLEVFYNEGPWLLLYFQPDFYGVSNRVKWQERRDEEVDIFDASLAN